MELFLTTDKDSYFLKLLVSYTRISDQITPIQLSKHCVSLSQQGIIKFPSLPCLVTDSEDVLITTISIAFKIAELSYTDSFLLGSNSIEKAEVISVFEMSNKLSDEDLINHYTKILEPRIFVTSNNITLADMYLFTRVQDRVSDFSDSDKGGKYIHFFRWYNHIQNLNGIKEFQSKNGRQLVQPPSPFAEIEVQKKKQKK